MSGEGWTDIRDGGSGFVAALGAALLLSGCGTATVQDRPEPIVRTITVDVPVAAACVPATLAPRPSYPDTDASLRAADDAAERYLLMGAGRKLRDARLNELEPIVAGCQKGSK
jgi:hypothetical protein